MKHHDVKMAELYLKNQRWLLAETYDEVRQAAHELAAESQLIDPNAILKRIEANRKAWRAAKRAPKKPKQGG